MILLDNKGLKAAFEDIVLRPNDNEPKERLMALVSKVIKVTTDRYPISLREDLSQELLITILKKAAYIAERYCKGEIKDATGYIFRFLHNAAINCFEKEKTYAARFMSLEDVKVDKAAFPTAYKKTKVIERIRSEVFDYLVARFPNPKDSGRAIKYIDVILEGRRPTFKTGNIKKFYHGRDVTAKEAYSITLSEIKKRLIKYRGELLAKDR